MSASGPLVILVDFAGHVERISMELSSLYSNDQVTHSRTGRRISHGYNQASFMGICIGP